MKLHLAVAWVLTVAFVAGLGVALSREPDDYGSWMKRPPDEWPRISVVNQIDYDDKHHPVAGCGFLLEVDDEVLAATAKHVLSYFKSAQMDSVDFQGTLKSWKMFPKDRPSDVVVVDKLINRDPGRVAEGRSLRKGLAPVHDPENARRKIQPLRIRTTPLVKGEPVYLIGWRYPEKECPQIVFDGVFVRSEKDSVCITIEKLIDNTVPGLSGSPVIDGKGYLIGMMSRG